MPPGHYFQPPLRSWFPPRPVLTLPWTLQVPKSPRPVTCDPRQATCTRGGPFKSCLTIRAICCPNPAMTPAPPRAARSPGPGLTRPVVCPQDATTRLPGVTSWTPEPCSLPSYSPSGRDWHPTAPAPRPRTATAVPGAEKTAPAPSSPRDRRGAGHSQDAQLLQPREVVPADTGDVVAVQLPAGQEDAAGELCDRARLPSTRPGTRVARTQAATPPEGAGGPDPDRGCPALPRGKVSLPAPARDRRRGAAGGCEPAPAVPGTAPCPPAIPVPCTLPAPGSVAPRCPPGHPSSRHPVPAVRSRGALRQQGQRHGGKALATPGKCDGAGGPPRWCQPSPRVLWASEGLRALPPPPAPPGLLSAHPRDSLGPGAETSGQDINHGQRFPGRRDGVGFRGGWTGRWAQGWLWCRGCGSEGRRGGWGTTDPCPVEMNAALRLLLGKSQRPLLQAGGNTTGPVTVAAELGRHRQPRRAPTSLSKELQRGVQGPLRAQGSVQRPNPPHLHHGARAPAHCCNQGQLAHAEPLPGAVPHISLPDAPGGHKAQPAPS